MLVYNRKYPEILNTDMAIPFIKRRNIIIIKYEFESVNFFRKNYCWGKSELFISSAQLFKQFHAVFMKKVI